MCLNGRGFLLAFFEEYRRYRLSDIEAIIVAKTPSRLRALLYIGIFLILGAVAVLLVRGDSSLLIHQVMAVTCGVTSLAFLALLIRHFLLGPMCVCELQTNRSRVRLQALRRYRKALEVAAEIESTGRAGQADLLAKDLGKSDSHEAADWTDQIVDPGSSENRSYRVPRLAWYTFVGFILVGALSFLAISIESMALMIVATIVMTTSGVLLAFTFVFAFRKSTPESLRSALWTLQGLYFLAMIVGMVYYVIVSIREPSYTVGFTGPMEAYLAIVDEGGVLLWIVFATMFLGMTCSSVWGLMLIGRWNRRIATVKSISESRVMPEPSA